MIYRSSIINEIWKKLVEIVAVGQGLFGVVFQAKSKVHTCVSNTVVVKKFLVEGEADQKEFIKEARMLHNIKLDNISKHSANGLML